MIINIENGDFTINKKMVFERRCLYSDIIFLNPENRTWNVGNGYRWIYFDKVLIDGLFFNIGLCFKNEKLKLIDFGFQPQKIESSSWDNWSEQTELSLRDKYDEWLTNEIGTKRNFSWGKVRAFYDPRGGYTSISINYW